MVPPRRTASIAVFSAASRSMPTTCMTFSMIASGTTRGGLLRERRERRAVRLHADGVDDGVRAAAVGRVAHRRDDVVLLGGVDDGDPAGAGPRQPLGDDVGAEHLTGAEVLGDPGAHVTDRPEPEHQRRCRPAGCPAYCTACHAVGQHVGEVDEAVVRRALGHLDRQGVAEGHPQVLGLAARHLAVELRVAEQRGAEAVLAVLGGLALGLQALRAHPAGAAGDVEGDDDAVAGLDRGDLLADLADDAHRLVAHDVADAS